MQPTIFVPGLAALARGLSHSNSTRRRSCWPYIRHLVPCGGGLQDHLCRFTSPLILCTLDAFPSNQGKFRVWWGCGAQRQGGVQLKPWGGRAPLPFVQGPPPPHGLSCTPPWRCAPHPHHSFVLLFHAKGAIGQPIPPSCSRAPAPFPRPQFPHAFTW